MAEPEQDREAQSRKELVGSGEPGKVSEQCSHINSSDLGFPKQRPDHEYQAGGELQSPDGRLKIFSK